MSGEATGSSRQSYPTTKTTKPTKPKANTLRLPKWVREIGLGKIDNPSPDPVHGVGSRNHLSGDAFNGQLIQGTPYRVGMIIGVGQFGLVCLARNVKTNAQLAVKIERQAKSNQLSKEWAIYSDLNKTDAEGIPRAYHFGLCGKRQALVLELLGPSLEHVLTLCGRKFSEHTVLLLAVQLITRLEHLHFHNIINRDIKPENLLICKPPKRDKTIFIVDFGVGKYFRDPTTKRHIPFKIHKSLIGTPLYMSIHSHSGFEQSRRDDLESLGYVLINFLRGSLPWDSAQGKRVLELKKEIPLEELCKAQPPEFVEYMKYVRKLDFEETPDYSQLRRLFRLRLQTKGYDPDGAMDWSDMVSDPKHMKKLQSMNRI